jgi:HSP20 family protein
VKSELPGIGKEDIPVSITAHLLTIKGEKTKKRKSRKKTITTRSAPYGSFSRSVDLPGEVQIARAQSAFKNGLLGGIRLPRAAEPRGER